MQTQELMDEVKTLRDELKVKSHLFKMETKDKWSDLEDQYKDVVAKVDRAKATAGNVGEDVIKANKFAFKKIKEGYNQIKNDLS